MTPSRPASLRRRLDALGLRMGARLDADWADQSMPWVFAAVLFGLLLAMSLAVVRQLDGGPGLGVWSQARGTCVPVARRRARSAGPTSSPSVGRMSPTPSCG